MNDKRFALLLAVLLLLTGVFVWAMFFRSQKLPLLAMSADDVYPDPLPPNALAQEDVKSLRQANTRNIEFHPFSLAPSAARPWKLGGPDKNAVVVYLNAHGIVNEQNEPCLLMKDSDPWTSASWHTIDSVLAPIRERAIKENSKPCIVLILDVIKEPDYRDLEIPDKDFVQQVEAKVESGAWKDLVVILSADTGQLSWPAPELGNSVFGHFLREGLRGAADVRGGNADGQVTCGELVQFLQSKVANYARESRRDAQEPRALNLTDSKKVAALASVPATYEPLPVKAYDVSEDVIAEHEELWRQHEALRRNAETTFRRVAYRKDPVEWATLERKLLRFERLLLAGADYEKQRDVLRAEIPVHLESLSKVEPLPLDPQLSLSMMQAWAGTDRDEDVAHHFTEWLNLQTKPAKEPSPEAAADQKDKPEAKVLPDIPRDYPTRAQAAWSWLLTRNGDNLQQQIDSVREFLSEVPQPEVDPIEIHFAKMIGEHLRPWPDDPGDVLRAFGHRDVSERASWHSEARAHYFVQQKIDNQDVSRRQREDDLFAGPDATAYDRIAPVQPHPVYSEALEKANKVAADYRFRDEVLADLFHALRWMAYRPTSGTRAAPDATRLAEGAKALCDELDRALNNPEKAPYLGITRNQETEAIRSDYFSESEQLVSDAPSSSLARLAAVLRLPWTTGANRGKVWRRFHDLQQTAFDRNLDQEAASGISHSNLEPAKSESVADSTWDHAWNVWGETRAVYGELNSTQKRPRLSDLDVRVRARAVFLSARSPDTAARAIPRQLELYDRRRQVLWQCERTLEDFWGPQGRPFFEIAANGYLQIARRLAFELPAFQEEFQGSSYEVDLSKQFEQRRKASQQFGLAQSEVFASLVEATKRLEASPQLGLQSRQTSPATGSPLNRRFAIQETIDLPEGVASLDVRETETTTSGPQFRSVLRISGQASERPLLSDSRLETVLFYRGHVGSLPVELPPPGPLFASRFEREAGGKPTVLVRSDPGAPGLLLFVLDCSASMAEPIAGGSTRMDLARDTLLQALNDSRLAEGRFRVGLVLFGHRVGWKKDGSFFRRPQVNEELKPNDDVEVVISPERVLDNELRQRLGDVLRQAQPTGQTPLYFAIERALEEIDRAAFPNSTTNLVVITDGVNKQSKEDGPPNVIRDFAQLSQLLAQPRYQSVRVSLIGLDLAASRRQSAAAVAELESLARSKGGRLKEPAGSQQLLQALLDSVPGDSVRFTVQRSGSKPEPQSINQSLPLNDFSSDPTDYVVRLPGARDFQITAEGGEAFELVHNRQAGRLEYKRYQELNLDGQTRSLVDPPTDRQEATVKDPRSGLQFAVTPFQPRFDALDRNVTFYVALQPHDRTTFCRRPKQVWATIRPLSDTSSKSDKYVFTDLDFVPGTPVPVLRFQAADWPNNASRAEIGIAFGLEPPSDAKILDARRQPELRVESISRVFERTTTGEPEFQIFTDLLPDEVTHRYHPLTREIEHNFKYSQTPKVLEIRCTRRADANVLTTPETMIVAIPGA